MARTTSGEIDSQLDALVQRGAPFSEFTQLLGARREAARYLARAYAQRFYAGAQAKSCAACTGGQPSGTIVYRWNAVFFKRFSFGALDFLKLAVGHLGVTIEKEIVSFDTYHPLCARCGRRIRFRRWIANVLNFIGLFTLIVAGVATAITWSGFLYFDKPSDRQEWRTMALGCTGVLAAGILCLRIMGIMRVPPDLRFLARRPFSYHSSRMLKKTS
jgi:hypothetical protein